MGRRRGAYLVASTARYPRLRHRLGCWHHEELATRGDDDEAESQFRCLLLRHMQDPVRSALIG